MRSLGLILGGLFLADGLIALIGGRRAVKWTEHTIGSRLPRRWRRVLKETARMDKTVLTAWGINNVAAGVGLLLAASLSGAEAKEPDRVQPELEAEPAEPAMAI